MKRKKANSYKPGPYSKIISSNIAELISKLKVKCTICSESHISCLEFHHINKEDKKFNISNAVRKNINIGDLKKEISKCVVLCANCHRKTHYDETAKTLGID